VTVTPRPESYSERIGTISRETPPQRTGPERASLPHYLKRTVPTTRRDRT